MIVIISLFALAVTMVLQNYYIKKVSNLSLLKKIDSIELNKKSCIKELHRNKKNIPTMGGMAMSIIFIILMSLIMIIKREFYVVVFCVFLYAILGFVDDFIKIKKLRDGVSYKEKLLGLTLISVVTILCLIYSSPYVNGIFIAIVFLFLLILSTNSMNLTDGVDGLALSISCINFIGIIIISYGVENKEILYMSCILLAICIGTLWYNRYPAKVFMGDTGSLFLGGAIAVFYIKLGLPILSVVTMIVCHLDTLSVVIQLLSLKYRKKKVFLIAPFHHHLEKKGWKETNIVVLFTLVTFVFNIIAVVIGLWYRG